MPLKILCCSIQNIMDTNIQTHFRKTKAHYYFQKNSEPYEFILKFLTVKKLIFENFSRLRGLSAPQVNIFVQILVNLDKKSAKMFIFFVKITKFSRAPSARENYLKTT